MEKETWNAENGGGGPYAGGPPGSETVNGHRSAAERFSDDGGRVVPWTAELALKVLGVGKASREEQVAVILAKKKPMSPEAYAALKAAGYPVPDGTA